MENYNLTAEIKKISGAINNSSPNTELGNINGSVGNLDTAMQSVATAIGNISIPNTGSNIDGVATAINNKTIPDPTSNITAVANAIVSMAGGKDLDDLITILTTMNGNIANLGSNHVTSITAVNDGFRVTYGNGTTIVVPNLAINTRYTDTNNIGATDVQGAVDVLTVSAREQSCINGSRAKGIEWDIDALMVLVRNGSFDKFAIGDYITDANTGIEFAIAAKNHYTAWSFAGGNTRVNHIVLMPITALATRYAFNSTNTNSGGYAGSTMPANMVIEYNKLSATIRGYCRETRIFENNKGSWAWADRYMRLPTATEVFGNHSYTSTELESNGDPCQLPLCQSNLFKFVNDWYWLLDPSSYNTTRFCVCSPGNSGFGYNIDATGNGLVRPLIVLA